MSVNLYYHFFEFLISFYGVLSLLMAKLNPLALVNCLCLDPLRFYLPLVRTTTLYHALTRFYARTCYATFQTSIKNIINYWYKVR